MDKNFNEQQLKAITYDLAPLLVMAGAGTGKTTVLVGRITYLINEIGLYPDNILAITFTNKAADEMNQRLKSEIYQSLDWIGTFHSICVKILRRDIEKLSTLKRYANFKILDEDDKKELVKTVINELEIDKKNEKIYLNAVNYYKLNNCTNISELENYKIRAKLFLEDEKTWSSFKKIMNKYLQKCEDYNYLDFDDIINFTILLLENCVEVRDYWVNKFEYILVDEFQDTNQSQYQLIELLAGKDFNVFAVGDEDQMIYTFRGADKKVIQKFINHFGDKKIDVIKLEENYRSTNQILDVANDLINKNNSEYKKQLYSKINAHLKPILNKSISIEEEAFFVANKIEQLINSGVNPDEIAILYRNNHLSRSYEQALIYKGIKYNLFGGFKFYQRAEIKNIISYLNVINSFDEMSILRIINIPKRKIGDATIKILSDYAHKANLKLWNVLEQNKNIEELSPYQKQTINSFVELINDLKTKLNELDIKDFFDYLIKQINYYDYVKSTTPDKLENVSRNIEELKSSIVYSKDNQSNWKLSDYLQDVVIYTTLDDKKRNKNAINLMTVHGAKGLEFKYVFLVSFNELVFPSRKSLEEKDGLEEERRLAYVAITRAKHELYLCTNQSYNHNLNLPSLPSRFINEINPNLLTLNQRSIIKNSNLDIGWFDSKNKTINKSDFYDADIKINNFKLYDKVIHTVFKEGTIIKIEDDLLEIDFGNKYGIKKIISNHKSLKRVLKN